MKNLVILLILLATTFSNNFAQAPAKNSSQTKTSEKNQSARELIQKSIEALGGEAALSNLKTLKIESVGFQHFLEQSERPEGPWITAYEQVSELRDLKTGRVRRTSLGRSVLQSQPWLENTLIISDGIAARARGDRQAPGSTEQIEEVHEQIALSPERLLFTALEANNLKEEKPEMFLGIQHRVVSFDWRGGTARIFFNPHHFLPMAVETIRAYPENFFFGVWGDVSVKTIYTDWILLPGGIRYPRQWTTRWNGYPHKEASLTTIEPNAAISDESFSIKPEVKDAFAKAKQSTGISRRSLALKTGFDGKPKMIHEPAEGIVIIPGFYTVTLVRQPDGIVILEAPISAEYTIQVIEEAKKRFPGLPIKAVVSTGDAWTYIGGVREYAAQKIPVYALDLNQPILERLVNAPFRFEPDNLAKNQRKPLFKFISEKTVIGIGANRIELYPVRGTGGERMMVAYFPEHDLLYGSDLIQPLRQGGFFMPQYLSEVAEIVKKNKLEAKKVYAMHAEPLDWAEVEAAINKVVQAD